ncbi:sphingosine kinase 2 [Strix uralensis]|uniref:sphingosine kinase 2 n=1 Tax=Strix uralensis TaxID=36305 RepID=UPI003DA3D57C
MTEEEPLLEGDFGGPPGAGGGPRFHLRLTRTELQILGGSPGGGAAAAAGGGVLRLADVVGCHTLRAPSLPAAAFFAVYAYPPRCRGGPGGPRRRRRAPTFRVDAAPHYEGNRATAERWARAIRCLVRGLPLPPQAGIPPEPRRRRLLLLLNPFGGRGQALSWCQTHVLPMITEADISFNLIQTERANHARELVTGISLDEWDGIVTVSGDGLLYEVVNGLMDRPDWAAALRMPLGILPCGSGNALAAAINCHAGLAPALGLSLLQNCAVLLCRGTPSPLDLVSVTTASGTRVFSFLSVAWGLVADVDIESERLRRLGPARFALGAAARLLALHTYRGRLSYLPAVPRSATADATAATDPATAAHVATADAALPRALSDLGLCAGTSSGPGTPEGDGGDWGDAGDTLGLGDTPGIGDTSRIGDSLELGQTPGLGDVPGIGDTARIGDPPGQKGAAAAGDVLVQGDPPIKGDPPGHGDPPGDGDVTVQGDASSSGDTPSDGDTPGHRDTPSPGDTPSHEANRVHGDTLGRGATPSSGDTPIPGVTPRGGDTLGHGATPSSGDTPIPGVTPRGGDTLGHGATLCSGDTPRGGDTPRCGDTPIPEDTPSAAATKPHGVTSIPENTPKHPSPPAPPSPPGGPVDDLLVPLGQPVPPSWVTLEGDFVLVLAIYQSHLGAELVAAPRARPDDGLIHLCYVRAGVSRGALLRALLAMTRGGGGGGDAVVTGPPLARVPARAFRLEPLTPRGVLTVDGERVEYGPLQGQIHRGLARVLLTPAAP